MRIVTLLTMLAASLACTRGSAQEQCPDVDFASAQTPRPRTSVETALDADIDLEMDSLEAKQDGQWRLNGDVVITQGERQLKTRDATYDPQTETFATENGVEYSDPDVLVRGEGAEFNPTGDATFKGAEFALRGQSEDSTTGARGRAQRISANRDGRLSLDGVRYTTCPLGNDDWVLTASDIDISQRAGLGTGRNVRLDFKGIPILYAPIISFPVGYERKSGFLFPSFGTSSRNGTTIVTPWYWNIAPNYDATFSPAWYSKRGGKLDTEFRYMNASGRGMFSAEYLPDDKRYDDSRSLLRFYDQSNFTERLRLDLDAANVSDDQWFEDFGQGPEGTSVNYLNRVANLSYLDDYWLVTMRAQNFQTIDSTIAELDRPYTVLPQVGLRVTSPEQPFGLTFGLDGELSNFLRDDGVTGMRADVSPEIRMPLRGAGIYLEPAAGWRYTTYDLDDTTATDLSPSRSTAVMSVDGGATFERIWGSRGQRLQTLEPRFMYLYIPYRDQSDLPVFDTTTADFNVVQLFRTNRYVGADRLSNANQVSVGLTSRLIDADTGQQFITATVGQAYYFDAQRVSLPDEVLTDTQSSDIVAELNVTAYRNWNIRMGVQWDAGDMRSERGDVQFQYRPAYDRVVNLSYRFRRDAFEQDPPLPLGDIEQVESSVAWPIGDRWSGYARVVYSLEEKTTPDQFVGLEYRSCCWRMRFVTQRYVSNRNGDMDTSFLLQLELNGLSSVGTGADAFLERSIRGYSSSPPQR